jgi:8-oxo-dGTP diphosphatase
VTRGGDSSRILLGKRLNAHGEGTYALPGGHQEYGESPEETAARELEEETGLVLKGARVVAVENCVWQPPQPQRHYVTLFVAGEVHPEAEAVNAEPDKCAGWTWEDPDALPRPLFAPLEQLTAQAGRLQASIAAGAADAPAGSFAAAPAAEAEPSRLLGELAGVWTGVGKWNFQEGAPQRTSEWLVSKLPFDKLQGNAKEWGLADDAVLTDVAPGVNALTLYESVFDGEDEQVHSDELLFVRLAANGELRAHYRSEQVANRRLMKWDNTTRDAIICRVEEDNDALRIVPPADREGWPTWVYSMPPDSHRVTLALHLDRATVNKAPPDIAFSYTRKV